ncbi:PEP-CTERM motif protein [Pirellulimonas nuda]|uniref:PEP-CTERM motif protein n=1 Tax=Pirellulimonas nuda TaxID=2528009 RepID=A0A518DD55_9BACT|nr:PEP-CTERM sorting domain-containing protein [Pirellulimonas nuda]QDU89412.1 PEP-CTERM motif protein [Pirellulimonas nuda]
MTQHHRPSAAPTPPGRPQTTPNAPRLASKRAVYSIAAGAAVGVVPPPADGAVVYSGVQDLSIGQGLAQDLDINSDAVTDILLKNYVFFGGNYQGASVNGYPGKLVGFEGALAYASALASGSLVDATTVGPAFFGSMAYGAANPSAEFNDVSGVFLGLSFPIGGNEPEFLHYGWVRVSVNNANGTFVINDWAYQDAANTGILTGETGPLGVPGDFNEDGAVDAADYTVWRDNLGVETSLPNGVDTGGPVGQADYDLWVAGFGGPAPAAASAGAAVPEPSTLGLLAAGCLGVAALRRRQKRED